MSGSQTLSMSETRIEAVKLQSSAYGVTIPVVGGVNRVPGNLVWYGDFLAEPTTTTTGGGGKGGGVKTQNTAYAYSAAVIMGICQGPIGAVSRIWKGKEVLANDDLANNALPASQIWTVPASGAMTLTLTHGATIVGDPVVRVSMEDAHGLYIGRLHAGVDFAVAGGVFTVLRDVWRGRSLSIQYSYSVSVPAGAVLTRLNASLALGTMSQAAPSWLASGFPAEALAYPGLAYIHSQKYSLGTGAQVENHSFEVQGSGAYFYGPLVADCNPAEFAVSVLTHGRYGARMPGETLEVEDWSNYVAAAGLLMSPLLTEQVRASEFIDLLCRMTNAAAVWSVDRLRIVPYADAAVTGNGVTFTPNTTPLYDLNDDCWLQDGSDDPLEWTVKEPSDRFNHVRVEFNDRGAWDGAKWTGHYNKTIAEAKDDADIAANGLRTMDTISAPWICDAAVAQLVAEVFKQRSLNITGTGRFKLPWAYGLLECMDLVTLTDAGLGFDRLPVRVISVGEDEDGDLELEVEDWPLGTATPTRYPSQLASGFQQDWNVAPGAITTATIFEAPVELTTTGLELYVALNSTSPTWGGADVWISVDGSNYRRAARVTGRARTGRITGPVAGNVLPVDVGANNEMLTGSAADAAALATLCYVGGASPEYLAHTTATLTGAGQYNLTLAARGAYGTPVAAHSTNDPFVRVDSAVAKSGPLDLALIGQTVYFKFTSFNVFGGGQQSLGEVAPVAYAVSGFMARLPPSTPTGFTATAEPFGVRLRVNQNPEPDVLRYEYRSGASWVTAAVLEENGGTSYPWVVQNAGAYTVWVAAVDVFGNYSTPVSATAAVAAPGLADLQAALSGTDLNLSWGATAGSFAIAGYEVRHGASWAAGAVLQFVQSSKYNELVKWGGTRTYWVAAIDVKGNVGTPASLVVTITAPGAVQAQRSEVVDNNALLYWGAPVVGSLPVERYEVRKGATWAGGTVVGSNGNSTFAAIFEQQAGSFTYWITAVDSAGNLGAPAAVSATIGQPPDYVLRSNIDSTFTGIKTNLYLEAGKLIGPVSTTQTWATHFSGNGWATPADQVAAGFPLYAMPSLASGAYEEVFDYGTTLPATSITVTLNSTVLAGSVTASPTISWSADNVSYTSGTVGQAQVLAPAGFRYVKVRYDFTCTAGANLIEISGMNVRLASKQKTDSGKATITNATNGVVVNFNQSFIDADTPIVQPDGTTPLIPVVDFSDVPNPTSFTVYLYNTSGVKVTGSFSWTARGS
jgi:hypothetical protein